MDLSNFLKSEKPLLDSLNVNAQASDVQTKRTRSSSSLKQNQNKRIKTNEEDTLLLAKKERRKAQNRAAAQKSRLKKKNLLETLEMKYKTLEAQNVQLQATIMKQNECIQNLTARLGDVAPSSAREEEEKNLKLRPLISCEKMSQNSEHVNMNEYRKEEDEIDVIDTELMRQDQQQTPSLINNTLVTSPLVVNTNNDSAEVVSPQLEVLTTMYMLLIVIYLAQIAQSCPPLLESTATRITTTPSSPVQQTQAVYKMTSSTEKLTAVSWTLENKGNQVNNNNSKHSAVSALTWNLQPPWNSISLSTNQINQIGIGTSTHLSNLKRSNHKPPFSTANPLDPLGNRQTFSNPNELPISVLTLQTFSTQIPSVKENTVKAVETVKKKTSSINTIKTMKTDCEALSSLILSALMTCPSSTITTGMYMYMADSLDMGSTTSTRACGKSLPIEQYKHSNFRNRPIQVS